jgi:phospholipid/cholesterol/gamma-HCH transport system ATP-binding protein
VSAADDDATGRSDPRVTNPSLGDPARSRPDRADPRAPSPTPSAATGAAALPATDARPGDRARETVASDRDRRDGDRRANGARSQADEVYQQRRVRAAIQRELDAGASPDVRPDAAEPGPAPGAVIELEHVSLGFDGRTILEDVSFLAMKGETIVVVGESGTGKSTTLKLILRLLVPDAGCVYVGGQEIGHLSFEDALKVRQKMGMVFQGAALFDSMSIYENVAYPLREHTDLPEAEIERRVREKLSFVDLDPDIVMPLLPSSLSGGMRKRVGVARAIANDPLIMLYDEPTSGLDPLTTGTITRLIIKLQRELGVTSVVVSHDIRSVFRMASYVALLAEKRIRFFGTPEEMAASDDAYIQDFLGGL